MTIRTYCVLLAALAAIALSACATGPAFQPLNLNAFSVMPEVRLAKTFHTSTDAEIAAELGATRAGGSDSTAITGATRLGNRTFAAGETLDTNFALTTYDISVGWRNFPKSGPLGFEVSGGFAYADLHLESSSATGRGTESVSSPAARLSITGIAHPNPTTFIEANLTQFGTNNQFRVITGMGLSLRKTFGSHAILRGGYSWWNLEAPDPARSTVTLRFSGPSIGFGLKY